MSQRRARQRRSTPSPVAQPARTGLDRRDWLLALGIAAATLAVYATVRTHDFVNYDDPDYVTGNAQVLGGLTWSGVTWAFTTFHDGNWFPLTWLSHMLDVSLFGADAGAHHLTNAVIHALSAGVLFLALATMTRARAASALVAALFALHPLHVESVAWVAERKDVLCGFFSVLTLFAYAQYAARPGAARLAAVGAAFACALLAKSMAVTLPFVLLLLDVWPLRRLAAASWRRLVREKAPLFAMAIAASVVALIAQHSAGAMAALAHVPAASRVANAVVSYVAYLMAAIWPKGLAVFYPHPGVPPWWQIAGAVAVLAAVTAAAWRWRATAPFVGVGWLWYLGTLVPVIGLVQIGGQARADRYTYLPLVGLFIIAAWGLDAAVRRWPGARTALVSVAAATVVTCAVITSTQLHYWRTSVTLFEQAVRVTRGSYPAYNNLGEAYIHAGLNDRAVQMLSEAVRLEPSLVSARVNLGTALDRLGRSDEAAAAWAEAVRLNPNDAGAHAGLGIARARQGRTDEALAELREALRLDPSSADIHFNLGLVYQRRSQIDDAMASFLTAIRLNPGLAAPHLQLGNLLASRGRFDDAIVQLQIAAGLAPGDPLVRSNYGAALASAGRYEEAIAQFTAALQLNPSLEEARANLAKARQLLAASRGSGR